MSASSEELIAELVRLLDSRQFETAHKLTTKLLSANPNHILLIHYHVLALIGKKAYEQAISYCDKLRGLQPTFSAALSNKGIALRNLGNLTEAIECFREALEIEPNDPSSLANLGNCYTDLDDLANAIKCYERALSQVPESPQINYHLGLSQQRAGNVEAAIGYFKEALKHRYKSTELLLNLGKAHTSLGNFNEAIECYRDITRQQPDNGEALRRLSLIKKFKACDDEDLSAMLHAVENLELNNIQRMHLGFAMGKAFDDLRDYEKAFKNFTIGNSLKRATFKYSIEAETTAVDRMLSVFCPDFFEKMANLGSSDKTPIFIIGMPRSGTTLVEQILSSHAQVFGGGEYKHFAEVVTDCFINPHNPEFGRRLADAGEEEFEAAGKSYIERVRRDSESASFISDKMPLNFHLVGMIKVLLPNAKVIHCRRSAADTCFSIFRNHFASDGPKFAYDLTEIGRYYNLYLKIMSHWNKVLPGYVYEIDYERLVAEQREQTEQLLSFCGLEWDEACAQFYKNKRQVNTVSTSQVRSPIYKDSIEHWTHYKTWLSPLLDVLSDPV